MTLTFSEKWLKHCESKAIERSEEYLEGYEIDNAAAAYAVDRFALRWKKKFGRRPRRWLITELGGQYTERLHLHGILFEKISKEDLEALWKYGHIWIGDYCNEGSIHYIVKYMQKVDKVHKYYKGKVFTSPGIGRNYIGSYNNLEQKRNTERDYYKLHDGRKVGLPIYYRNLTYDDITREDLWLKRLDKQERWINGIRIDLTKKNAEEYEARVRAQEQRNNRMLGYGEPVSEKTWDKMRYEIEKRDLLRAKRGKNLGNKEN